MNASPVVNASALPAVTVALCTRDRSEHLRRALTSLAGQRLLPTEVLVVDNAPGSEATRELVLTDFPGVRYLRENRPGLDFARNRALREALGEIVAFVDDDAVADPGWIEAISGAFSDPSGPDLCTGRILPLELRTPGQQLFEANGGLFAAGTDRLRVPDPRRGADRDRIPNIARALSLGSGCNLAVRRRVALELGGFDEALDLGTILPGGGDNDLVWRMLEAGKIVQYEPTALVHHQHREQWDEAVHQIAGHQRAAVALVTKAVVRTGGARRFGVLGYLVWRLVKPGVRVVRRLAGRDPLPLPVLLSVWWQCLLGVPSYAAGRREAESRRTGATTEGGER